jgi:hypothetical protein
VGAKNSAPSWDWNPLCCGLCSNEEFESASIEARSEGSGWLEIIVQGKLGTNKAGKLAEAKQARAGVPPIILPVAVRIRIESAHSLELTYRMGDNRRWQLWSGGRRLRK